MAYQTYDDTPPRRTELAWEYRFYFTLVFLIAVPVALVQWAVALARPRGMAPNPGVLRRAMSQARVITPTIFSA